MDPPVHRRKDSDTESFVFLLISDTFNHDLVSDSHIPVVVQSEDLKVCAISFGSKIVIFVPLSEGLSPDWDGDLNPYQSFPSANLSMIEFSSV